MAGERAIAEPSPINSENKKKSKKRKQRGAGNIGEEEAREERGERSKINRVDQSTREGDESSSPWRNLRMILSLQDKNIDILKKVDLAFDYVKSGSSKEKDESTQFSSQVTNTSRTLVFLNNWVQSVLISSEKKLRLEGKRHDFETIGSYLDLRCWKILQFCLEESKKFHFSLACSRDFLRVIRCVAMDTSSFEGLEFYEVILECISLTFSFHGGVANENLDLWILLVDKLLELVLKIIRGQFDGEDAVNFLLRLSCSVLDPFAKFLRIHPTRKNGFCDFINKLLEPSLHLLHVRHSNTCGNNIESRSNLFKLVDEILSQGLFHPIHIDGFLTLQSTARYKDSSDLTPKEKKFVNKSYHRHLFDKVEKILENGSELVGLGELFHLFVSSVTKHKGASTHMDAELRKSIFDYFVQIMEYLLTNVNKFLESDGIEASILTNIPNKLKSINDLLVNFIQEKVYLKIEDTTEGGFLNFLRLIYDMVVSFTARITDLERSGEGSFGEIFIIVRKELVVIVHHLLNIEYEVVGDDLQSLWSMVFTFLPFCYSSEIMRFGCRLIDLYRELRQVDSSIFSLCIAIRLSSSSPNSTSTFLCSSEFKLSLKNAINSLPEGQAAGFIRQLNLDIKESLDWLSKSNSHGCDSLNSDSQAELLGSALSEVYTIILDSIPISSGNSYLVAVSLKNLIEIIRPGLTCLVSLQTDRINDFSITVHGRTLSEGGDCKSVPICWILVFFCRLLFFSRSLFREVISLMTPDALKKIGDSFTVHSGGELLELNCPDEGFFSWFTQPSAPLLDVICSIFDINLRDSALQSSLLVYTLSSMAIQRLNDLNLLIESSEYSTRLNQTRNDSSLYRKRVSKSIKHVAKLREEGAGLTKFIMGFVPSLFKDGENLSLRSLLSMICQSVDVWCSHASKKDLKNFLTLVIEASISHENNRDGRVNAHQIAREFMSNVTSFEQSFVCRYMASRICKILNKSVSSIFVYSEVELNKPSDWVEALSALENLSDGHIGNLPLTQLKYSVEFDKCQSLLALLMRMPEDVLSLSASSLALTCILNLERLLVASLLGSHSASCSLGTFEIIQLFTSCRKVQTNLMTSAFRKNRIEPECSFPLSWLLKSLFPVIEFKSAPGVIIRETQASTFTLMDHTSNALLAACKDQFERAIKSFVPAKKRQGKDKGIINHLEDSVEWKSVLEVAETLEGYVQNSLAQSTDAPPDINNLSAVMACYQGLLWGLASAFGDVNSENRKIKFSGRNDEMATKIESWVNTCMDFINFFLKKLFIEDNPTPSMPTRVSDDFEDASSEGEVNVVYPTDDTNGGLGKCNLKKNPRPPIPDLEAFLNEIQNPKHRFKKSLLLEILGGENVGAAYFLRQLFFACSAIIRLNLRVKLPSISWGLISTVLNISQLILFEFSSSIETPHQFTFLCLSGVVKFLEEFGSYFTQFDPSISRDLYVKLMGLHFKAIGKCISLEGKEATLGSRERGSLDKMSTHQLQGNFSPRIGKFGEFKERLRMSFKSYVGKSSEFLLLCAVQCLERALVGVPKGLTSNYEIICGNSFGEVHSNVAAGIDCLDLILEFVTGRIRISMIKKHIPSLVSCLFNIILHLQAPNIFHKYANSTIKPYYVGPDSGSVILMCAEVLTKIYGKPSFFQIAPCHIAESLRAPSALFNYFLQSVKSSSGIDRKFSIELYDASCRMLSTSIKHHQSETHQYIALLEDSIGVLLHCLEIVSIESVSGRDIFSWEIQEAIKCASSLRRVYEEVRQQKDVFGKNSFQFLSRYIWVYCGFGPAKKGIIREVDEALKPGVYALIDSCSADDLQLLHTVFGEGPCRSRLATLQHDYKLNFQYEGKV